MNLRYGVPARRNIEMKRNEKRTKCRQLAFELREGRVGYKIIIVPLLISALGGGTDGMIHGVDQIFGKNDLCIKIVGEIQKTILIDSETTIRKVLSGLVQSDYI